MRSLSLAHCARVGDAAVLTRLAALPLLEELAVFGCGVEESELGRLAAGWARPGLRVTWRNPSTAPWWM
jgi:hypothetical protein